MNIQNFTKQNKLSKTLRFKLIPVGETLQHVEADEMLQKDAERAAEYPTAKRLIDERHKKFIDRALEEIVFSDETWVEYFDLYLNRKNKAKEVEEIQGQLRAVISKRLTNDKEYKLLFGKELFATLQGETEEEQKAVEDFKRFSTYFEKFYSNRENMYTENADSTGIANRIINENLPKFFDNILVGKKVLAALPPQIVEELNGDFRELLGITVEEILTPSFAGKVFSQRQIDRYNGLLGGYSTSTGEKVQGLNEKINLYNQQQKTRIPQLKLLFKQILSDRESFSYIPEEFATDDEVITSIKEYCKESAGARKELVEIWNTIEPAGIFVGKKALGLLSEKVFGNWEIIRNGLSEKKEFYSLSALQQAGERGLEDEKATATLVGFITGEISRLSAAVEDAFARFDASLHIPYQSKVRLAKNDADIEIIKALVDALKNFQSFAGQFYDGREEQNADPAFYGSFVNAYESILPIIKLYNKVRNYISKKPYSLEKYKLNFDSPTLLSGWDINKEPEYRSALLRKNGNYYLAILMNSKAFSDYEEAPCGVDAYEKMIYRQIPNAAKYFSSKQILPQNPPKDIVDLLAKKKADNKSLTPRENERLIDYIQHDFIPNYRFLRDKNGRPYFDFHFKAPGEYLSLNEFFLDIDSQAYAFRFASISTQTIDALVQKGDILLFRLYNKDFSEHSKGTPNLHTLYFKALFDTENAENGVLKLCGGAEMFYRPASLKLEETTIHHANEPLKNKNKNSPRATSTYAYDIIKNRRFTAPQFQLHIPIELNSNADRMTQGMLNRAVRATIAKSDQQYIIGIDRGERNLIYVSVIDAQGNIVEQHSLNEIVNLQKGIECKTDYRQLLDEREEGRLKARQSWTTIEGIKELKEGYISQVVHKICQLVVKYNAVIVMENLNSGFKNIRSAVEKSVYQKFEKMLTDKLAYLVVDKKREATAPGGILNAYQLACPVTSYTDMKGQNGILFYVDAWNTSKIDPTTGFVDLLHPKYETIEKAKELFGQFEEISYCAEEDLFVFGLRYDEGSLSYQKQWKVCTYGDRIVSYRNKEKNSQWDSKRMDLSPEFKALFEKYGIDYRGNLKEAILRQTDKKFFENLIFLLKITLQMRNSVPNSTKPEDDYMLSPIRNQSGGFYDSRKAGKALPADADANGAFNIARKGLILVNRIQETNDKTQPAGGIQREEWLQYAQEHPAK